MCVHLSLLGAPIGGVGAAPPNIIIISIILVDAGSRPRCDRNFRHVWNFSLKFKLTFIINLINSSVGNGTWPWDSPGPGMMRKCWDSQEDFNVLINCLSLFNFTWTRHRKATTEKPRPGTYGHIKCDYPDCNYRTTAQVKLHK